MPNTYFDNAATSFPKPAAVASEISRYLTSVGGSYGRSASRRALSVAKTVEETRDALGRTIGVSDSGSISFTANATHAINTVLYGLLTDHSHVCISPMEHNAVMRPLCHLAQSRGVEYTILPHGPDGLIDPAQIKSCIRQSTKLLIINHMSNVNGVIQPIAAIKSAIGAIPLLVDAAQSLGACPLQAENIDFITITGHKSLLGPTGIGALYCLDDKRIPSFFQGGTGSNSESFSMPEHLPDRLEAGTPNIAGIFGLLGALANKPQPAHSHDDFINLMHAIRQILGIQVYGAANSVNQGTLFSINHKRLDCAAFGRLLYDRFSIETRVGLQCAPLAHTTIGTAPNGTVRIAPSIYHTADDFAVLVNAIAQVSAV
jgi:cysteine desulfurase family protein